MRTPAEGVFTSFLIPIALMSVGAGCAKDADVVSAAPRATQSATLLDGGEVVQVVGLLTRKGPEIEAWWALTDDRGLVWRLELANADQLREFQQWQNRRIKVNGVRIGAVLSTPRVRVERALPMH